MLLTQPLAITDVTAGCAPITQEPITRDEADTLARSLKALADPARLRIISLVAAADRDGVCVCDFQQPLELSQPTVSHHLKVLTDAGFLTREKRSVWVHYTLAPGALAAVSDFFAAV